MQQLLKKYNNCLGNMTVTVSLKSLSNFWISLEMSLINCKIKLKLTSKSHCLLFALGADNDDGNSNKTIFTIKDTKLFVSLYSLYQEEITKNYQNFLANNLKDQCIGMNIKQKVRTKIRQMSIDIFFNQALQELTDCLFWFV